MHLQHSGVSKEKHKPINHGARSLQRFPGLRGRWKILAHAAKVGRQSSQQHALCWYWGAGEWLGLLAFEP